jgi:hypothetical protein
MTIITALCDPGDIALTGGCAFTYANGSTRRITSFGPAGSSGVQGWMCTFVDYDGNGIPVSGAGANVTCLAP